MNSRCPQPNNPAPSEAVAGQEARQVASAPRSDDPIALRARYDAVLEIAASLRIRNSVAELAEVVSKGWRFCANVKAWCLLGLDEGGLNAIISNGRDAPDIVSADAIPQSVIALWNSDRPRQWPLPMFLTVYPDLARWFGHGAPGDALVMVIDRRGQRFVFVVASERDGLGRLDYKFINTVAEMFVGELAYLRTVDRLTKTLEREAREDPLTGVANRWHFLAILERHWRDAMRRRAPISVLMADIDHFKLFNDRYGHPAGDECIRAVSAEMVAALNRPFDLVGRLGGEEFAILLPGTTEHGAALIAQRIIEAIDKRRIPHAVSPVRDHVTISMGAAMRVPHQDTSSKALIEAADRALYAAKREGRHRVSCESALAAADHHAVGATDAVASTHVLASDMPVADAPVTAPLSGTI